MTTTTVKINDKRITELSSLACSKKWPRLAWGCNDDPTSPDVFGINTRTGQVVTEIEIEGMKLNDTEALDVTKDNEIVLGAIGDNNLNRSSISIFIFPEPGSYGHYAITPIPYRLHYPDGKRYDSESLVAHPNSGRIYILTKQPGICKLFVAPPIDSLTEFDSKNPVSSPLMYVGSVPLSMVTDASFTPDAAFLAMRQKGVKDSIAMVDCLTLNVLKPFKVAKVKQPEACSIEPDSKNIIYGSEGKKSILGRTTIPQEYV